MHLSSYDRFTISVLKTHYKSNNNLEKKSPKVLDLKKKQGLNPTLTKESKEK